MRGWGGRLRVAQPEAAIARHLTGYVDSHPDDRAWLTDRMRHAARQVAVHGQPPRTGPRMLAWRALILAAERLHPGRIARLRHRAFLSDRAWHALREEARGCAPAMRTRRTLIGIGFKPVG